MRLSYGHVGAVIPPYAKADKAKDCLAQLIRRVLTRPALRDHVKPEHLAGACVDRKIVSGRAWNLSCCAGIGRIRKPPDAW